ncbi:NAD(P)-binding protein [Mycena metata]|uniref:NAD(P)-binding protein n=1 Tax=Mycena metata TaxID=1033252 RepID=A0AAD7HDS9_9AGAR|nr:NAD(P)-binding protein [Mycena metata]
MAKSEQLADLHGKVVLITGGNTGIGYSTIQILARRGAKVYMATRDPTKAKAAIKKMEAEGLGEGSVHFLELDLADPRQVSTAAKQFAESEERLDILNFSGLGPFHLTDDGITNVMVINHVSPFILTDTVLPLMKRTATEVNSDVRIVNLSSSMHAQVKPTTFAGKESLAKDYGPSAIKAMDTVLHAKALQKRLDTEKSPITCISIHPGVVQTQTSAGVMGSVPFLGPFLKRVVVPLVFGNWDAGGKAVAFAAASKDVAARRSRYKGAYLSQAQDPKLQEELWETTEKAVREMQL